MGIKLKFFISGLAAIAAAVLFSISTAYATNGYFSHGYSIQSKAMAGSNVALPLDSLEAAVNPAGMVFVGKRYDFGISFFKPNREYRVKGNPSGNPGTFGLSPSTVGSDSLWCVIPYFGANWMLSNEDSVGVSFYANGGMNTDYNTKTFRGSASTGVDLCQLFVSTTYAKKIAQKHAFGISAILAYQRFEAKGLEMFAGYSSDANHLTNNGHDDSYGYGARIGYLGKIFPNIKFGLSYQTKIFMSELDDYSGLFAGNGDFDIPDNWNIGLAVDATPALTFAFDVQYIYYSHIKSIGNQMLPNLQSSMLGNNNGAGFGWEDMTVYKIGIQWQCNDDWTWRAGYSYGRQPIPESEVMFNILAPGVMEHHATFGLTKAMGDGQELNIAVLRAFSKSIRGPNNLEVPGQQVIELQMDQWEVSIGYSWLY